jgi:undecaprenyl diphosphate synthase
LANRGVSVVTLYAFSTENWGRPTAEVDGLMSILAEEIEPQTEELHKSGVRLIHLGDRNPLDAQLQDAIAQEPPRRPIAGCDRAG